MEQEQDCPVCLVRHDKEIHAATLRVKEWFRRQVLMGETVDENPPMSYREPMHVPERRFGPFF